jgi:hypothetical protein
VKIIANRKPNADKALVSHMNDVCAGARWNASTSFVCVLEVQVMVKDSEKREQDEEPDGNSSRVGTAQAARSELIMPSLAAILMQQIVKQAAGVSYRYTVRNRKRFL